MTDYDPLAALSDIHAKRGYLLPHHGLMAISAPHLLERYDSRYSVLALEERHLSRHAHEFVWLGVLISCEESLGSHHVKRFVDAGGDAVRLKGVRDGRAAGRAHLHDGCLLYTSPSPRDKRQSRMPSSA